MPTKPPSDLPEDVGALHGLIVHQALEIEKLKHQLAILRRHRFGSKSEGLDQLELGIEDLEETASEAGTPSTSSDPVSSDTPDLMKKPKRKPLPEHLPREDVREVLDYVPGRFVVHRHVRVDAKPAYCARDAEIRSSGSCAGLEVRGPLTIVSPVPDLPPRRRSSRPLDPGRLGRSVLSSRRSADIPMVARPSFPTTRQCRSSIPAGGHQDRAAVDLRTRRAPVGGTGTASRVLSLLTGPEGRAAEDHLRDFEGLMATVRRRAPRRGDVWYLDEMQVKIGGKPYWLWRAAYADGYVLDEVVSVSRDKSEEVARTHRRNPFHQRAFHKSSVRSMPIMTCCAERLRPSSINATDPIEAPFENLKGAQRGWFAIC